MRRLLSLCVFACAAAFAGAPETPTASIYQLDARLTDQEGKARGLDLYRGHPVLITMF